MTQQTATIAEQTASSAEELSHQARQLQDTIAFFTLEESFQEQESKSNHQNKGAGFRKLKENTRTSERKAEKEETGSKPENSGAEIFPDDADEYDDEFERY